MGSPLNIIAIWLFASVIALILLTTTRRLFSRGVDHWWIALPYYILTYLAGAVLLPFLVFAVIVWSFAQVAQIPYWFLNLTFENFRTRITRTIPAVLLVGAIFTSLISLMIHMTTDSPNIASWGEGWTQNFSTELFGGFVAYILLNLLLGAQEQRQRFQEHRLNAMTRWRLAEKPQARQLLFADIVALDYLVEADLHDENLNGYDFSEANLRNTNLNGAKLSGADFREAQLENTSFVNADLSDANLSHVFWCYNPDRPVNFSGADLRGVSLASPDKRKRARLFVEINTSDVTQNIALAQVILPDGSQLTTQNGFERFTNPNHPDFWRSTDPTSPAYNGKVAGGVIIS